MIISLNKFVPFGLRRQTIRETNNHRCKIAKEANVILNNGRPHRMQKAFIFAQMLNACREMLLVLGKCESEFASIYYTRMTNTRDMRLRHASVIWSWDTCNCTRWRDGSCHSILEYCTIVKIRQTVYGGNTIISCKLNRIVLNFYNSK